MLTSIIHIKMHLPDKTIADGVLHIENGKIAALGEYKKEDAFFQKSRVIDGQGLVLAPGFIDLQVNGGFGSDFTETPASLWDVAAKLPQYGVTSFLPTIVTSPAESYREALEVMRAGHPESARCAEPLGLHMEGPFISLEKKGAHNPAYIQKPDPALVQGWSPDKGIRMVTLAPEVAGADRLIATLTANGVTVSAGHTNATHAQGMAAFRQGITFGTHLFNAMPQINHRHPGITTALLTADAVAVGIIADGTHTHADMVHLAWLAKGRDRLVLVTDAMGALGMPEGRYSLNGSLITVDETSARLEDGTLAGSILSLDQAVRNLIAFTGCPLADALHTVTANPARVIRLADRGALVPGYDADLVLLDEKGVVHATIKRGEWIFQRDEINRSSQ